MLDLSRLTDIFAEMAGNALQGGSADPQGSTDMLANLGLDPSGLAGLSEGEIMTLLREHGTDLTQFAPDELANFMSNMGLGDGASFLQGVFTDNRTG